jgi:hypothetical protein
MHQNIHLHRRVLHGALVMLERSAVKGCAMSRTDGIVTPGDRSSRQMIPRRTTYLTPKGGGDRSMLVKRGVTEDVYGAALQRLSDRAKAALPEPCATSPIARFSSQRREVRKNDLWVTQLTGWRKP